jgi:hypothetical protein
MSADENQNGYGEAVIARIGKVVDKPRSDIQTTHDAGVFKLQPSEFPGMRPPVTPPVPNNGPSTPGD